MYCLDYDCKYTHERPTLTTEGFQAKLVATKRGDPPTSETGLKVISRPCARSCEARESALVNSLVFINNHFHIGDLHYTELIMLESQRRH
jgi:hypothetical protein